MPNSISDLAVLPSSEAPLEILSVDPAFVIVAKPSGLLSVPGRHPQNRDCAITRLQQQFPEATVVHRLDYDTSGIMVFARHRQSHRALAAQFQQRQVIKEYTALVSGQPNPAEGLIDLPIAPDRERRPRCKICHREGKPSQTRYQCVDYDTEGDVTRVLLYPETGRSHQLRLHMQAIGHPMLGCDFYAPAAVRAQASRLMLHATRLGFAHPEAGEKLEFFCESPF